MNKKKVSSAFFCQKCGTQSPKWLGRCPQCNEWNTFVEEIINKESNNKKGYTSKKKNKPVLINSINYTEDKRIITHDAELNRVLGGGIVSGSIVLIGGEPGIGKSTLLLQLALNSKNNKILYVSGDESEKQVKMRAESIKNQ